MILNCLFVIFVSTLTWLPGWTLHPTTLVVRSLHKNGNEVVVYAAAKKKRARKDRLEQLQELSEAQAEVTAAWAERIATRLDTAQFVEVEDELLVECSSDNRDLERIDKLINQFAGGAGIPEDIRDWRLVWARSDAGLGQLGTGLWRVPLARLEDIFISLYRKSKKENYVRLTEIIRVLGPFPNVKNSLHGDFASQNDDSLTLNYRSGTDGTGKPLTGKARSVDFDIIHSSSRLLVLRCIGLSTNEEEWLVFEPETDLVGALQRLRVPADEEEVEG